MDHTDDVFRVILEDRQAGVVTFETLVQDVDRLGVSVDHLDTGTVQHDLFYSAVREIERAQDAVAVFFFDDTFGVTELQGAGNLFANGEDVAVGVGFHAKQAQHETHQPAHGGDDGRKDGDQEADWTRHGGGRIFGAGDGVGFGQNLGKDQHQEGHDQRGERDTGFAKGAGEERGCQRGCEDIDEVVAQQHRTDQAFVVFGDLQGTGGAAIALVGLTAQFAARGGG